MFPSNNQLSNGKVKEVIYPVMPIRVLKKRYRNKPALRGHELLASQDRIHLHSNLQCKYKSQNGGCDLYRSIE